MQAIEEPTIDITEHTGLVCLIAQRYCGRGLEWEDLCQEGSIGLIRAAERFDPARGWKFTTYASYWIRAKIEEALKDKADLIRTPRFTRSRKANPALRAQAERIWNATAIRPSDDLDVFASLAASSASTVDELEDKEETAFQKRILRSLLKDLGEDHRDAIVLRYGLDGGRPAFLHEIAEAQEVTKQRVAQRLEEALALVRAAAARMQAQREVA